MQRDDIRELRREVAEARQAAQDFWPVLPDGYGAGDPEKNRIIRATVDEGSGVTAGNTFTVDNIEPLCSGLDPSGGSSSFTLEIDNARNDYADNATIYAIEDVNAANGWSDFTGTGSETYRLVRGLVNEASGVTAGASFTIDNVEALAGGELPVASTADDVDLEIDEAKQAYSDNDEVIAIYDPAATNDWVDFTDIGEVPPQTYNVKVQEAKAYTDDHVSVKWLEDDLATEVGSAFDVYDPHGQFSTGGLDDVFGRITRVTDADTGSNRWELTHLEGLALTAYGTLAENEGATTSGKASSSSYNTEGIAWHESAPSGSINIVGLDGQQSGDAYVAVLSDPDASPPEYRAVKVPDQNTDVLAKVNASESAAGYLEDQLVNTGTLTAGYQRVYRRVAGDDDTIYFETEEASGSGDTVSWVAPDGSALVHMGNADADLYVWDDSGNEFVFSAGSKTLYNFTGRVLSSDIPVPAIEVETDVYVAIDNTSASVVTGTASGDSNANNGYAATAATSLTGWNGEVSFSISASTLLNPLGLEVNSGDTIMAVGDYNGTAARWAIVNVQSTATPIGVIEPVSIILDVPGRSGAVAGSAASSGDIYAMCNADNVGQSGVVIHGRTYDFTSASLGELIEPNTPVTVRLFNKSLSQVNAPASGLLFCDAKKIGNGDSEDDPPQEEYEIVSPLELRTLTGFDGDGTADQVITHVDGDIEWEDTGACS